MTRHLSLITHACESIRRQAEDALAHHNGGETGLSLEVLANMLSEAETLQRQIQMVIEEVEVIKYTGMRTVEVNFLNDQEAAKEGWSFVPFRSSLRSPPCG